MLMGAPSGHDGGLWPLRYADLQGIPQAHPLTVLSGILIADEKQMSLQESAPLLSSLQRSFWKRGCMTPT